MPKKSAIPDPTLPFTEIEIDGQIYKMCLDLGALAAAEDKFEAAGHEVNLLLMLPRLNLSNTRIVFAASLQHFHPEIGFDEALQLVTRESMWSIAEAIAASWKASTPEPEPGGKPGGKPDPPQPVL